MLDHVLNMYYITVDDLFQLDVKLSTRELTKRIRVLSELCQVYDVINKIKDTASSIKSLSDIGVTEDLMQQLTALTKRLQCIDDDLMDIESFQFSPDGQRYQRKRMIGDTINVLKYWEQLLINLDQFLQMKEKTNHNYIPNLYYIFTDNSLHQLEKEQLLDRLHIENTIYYKLPNMRSVEKFVIELELALEEIDSIINKMKNILNSFVNKTNVNIVEYL